MPMKRWKNTPIQMSARKATAQKKKLARALPPEIKKQSDEAVAYVNDNLTIQSLLYDMNLLPEQLNEGSYRWGQMINIISHFKAAIEAATSSK